MSSAALNHPLDKIVLKIIPTMCSHYSCVVDFPILMELEWLLNPWCERALIIFVFGKKWNGQIYIVLHWRRDPSQWHSKLNIFRNN